MKAVLISIQPKWCDLITLLRKTIEVRKTRPNLELPFKCYIYCSGNDYDKIFCTDKFMHKVFLNGAGKQKVIGEFVCDRVHRIGKRGIHNNFDYCYSSLSEWGNDDIEIEITDIQKSCIQKEELNRYGANSQCLYAWHISDLVIYDEPKELREFKKPCNNDCENCDHLDIAEIGAYEHTATVKTCLNLVTRPPQSWCYVEELR